MVSKIIALFLLLAVPANAAAPALKLHFDGNKAGAECQKLVEQFLVELRGIANDRLIELELGPSQEPEALKLRCNLESSQKTIELSRGDEYFPLRYSAKAEGFDASDWIPVQQKILRPIVLTSLAQLAPQSDADSQLLTGPVRSETQASNNSFYTKWWFWSVVAGIGTASYFLIRSQSHSNANNVEIR